MTDTWDDFVSRVSETLTDHPSIGPTREGEVDLQVGNIEFDVLLESTGPDLESQRLGYSALCDLLAERLKQGAGQVMGTLLINGDPDPEAFVTGLTGMKRSDGTFTPVLPVSRKQAELLHASESTLYEFMDPATAIIDIAASREPITKAVAETALDELDELVSRFA